MRWVWSCKGNKEHSKGRELNLHKHLKFGISYPMSDFNINFLLCFTVKFPILIVRITESLIWSAPKQELTILTSLTLFGSKPKLTSLMCHHNNCWALQFKHIFSTLLFKEPVAEPQISHSYSEIGSSRPRQPFSTVCPWHTIDHRPNVSLAPRGKAIEDQTLNALLLLCDQKKFILLTKCWFWFI